MELDQSVFAVSGGGSGLGAATARRIVADGGRVVIMDLANDPAQGGVPEDDNALFQKTDVTDPDAVHAALDAAIERFGRLDGAVNCAGVAVAMKTVNRGEPHDLDAFRKVIDVNLIGTFNVLRLVAARLAGNEPGPSGERGVIVNTASIAAYDGQIGQAAYAASKGGVASLTLAAARDLSRDGIRVMTIAPGLFDTRMLAMLPEEARQALAANVPFPSRLGDPDEYADLVAAIVANPMLNGEVIRLDGALRMPPK